MNPATIHRLDVSLATPASYVLVVLLGIAGTFGGIWGGPPLGDHEALVAQCARDMRLSGDWLVPRFLDTTFIRKPPLPYWLVAAGSYICPADPVTGLPVTPLAARLPSALSALGTVLLLWKLGSAMYGRAVGVVTALLASASLFILLYSVNATVEMLLTFCCTWAGAHFWFAVTTASSPRRFGHMLLFYFALGMGMLAKGPAPLAMVAVPLAMWWYLERPQKLLAAGGTRAISQAGMEFAQGLWSRTVQAFTRLWLFPGLLVFLAVFLPWMFAVAQKHPHAWDIWNWQYLQRFQGDYEDTRHRGPLYYVPIVLGLLLPWTLTLAHALAAPWLHRFRRHRRALFFVGVWGVVGVAVMSIMSFKKPYYILPALPALLLLIAPVLTEFLLIARGVTVPRPDFPGRRWAWLRVLAVTMCVSFLTGWYFIAPSYSNLPRVTKLHENLIEAGVPNDARIFWADQRPDARLRFYYGRASEHLVDPSKIVARVLERRRADVTVQQMAVERATELLTGEAPVFLILDREHLNFVDSFDPQVRSKVRVLTTVDLDGMPDDDDWVIITNDLRLTPRTTDRAQSPRFTHPILGKFVCDQSRDREGEGFSVR